MEVIFFLFTCYIFTLLIFYSYIYPEQLSFITIISIIGLLDVFLKFHNLHDIVFLILVLLFLLFFFLIKYLLNLKKLKYIGIFLLILFISFILANSSNNIFFDIKTILLLSFVNFILLSLTINKENIIKFFHPKEFKIMYSVLQEIENKYFEKYTNSNYSNNPYTVFINTIKPIFNTRIKKIDKYSVLKMINDFKGPIRGFVYEQIGNICTIKILGDCNLHGILINDGEIYMQMYDDMNEKLFELKILKRKELKERKEELLTLMKEL